MATRCACDPCQYIDECKSGEVNAATLGAITPSITRKIVVGDHLYYVYVGVTSGGSSSGCKRALKARRSYLVSKIGRPVDVMIGVYKSRCEDKASRCKKVKDHLIVKFAEFGLQQRSREVLSTDRRYQYVFVAMLKINYRDACKTRSDNLVRRIRAYISRESIGKFYIGITSGSDCKEALKVRRSGDSHKICHGINTMIGLVEGSDRRIRELEGEMIEVFERHGKNINRIGGGGGRCGAGPKYFLYLGLNVIL